jgi:DNA polymerase III epsilon subunit-like protein
VRELGDLDVLIVDCQATGATPAHGAVLELGWCVLRPSRAQPEHLQAHAVLLPEGQAVPSHVRRLIGFDPRQVSGAVAPDAAWRLLRAAMNADPMPTVIHFARFELAFLRDWADRFEPGAAAFPFDPVCLHAIACRLYPDLPRLSLRALAGHLGHGLHLTRRSLGHVEATAFIWQKLSAELSERGVRTWEELTEWLTLAGPGRSRSKKRRYPLARARYRALPDEPGVYRFLRSNGDVLYVGKAQSLRQRVASHFGASSTREHSIEMLTQVSDVQVTVTPTALEAALLENESIKALRPPYNLQLTSYDARAWFATRDLDSASTSPDTRHRIGPVPSALSLNALGALIALRSGEPPTRSLTARAVCAAERWAPEPQVFAAGFDEFTRRHIDIDVDASPTRPPRQAVLRAAKRLVALSRQSVKASDVPEPDVAEEARLVWDPERVARHLERALCQAYQLLRRGYWLRLLHDSAIVYREPGSERSRGLLIRGGVLVDAKEHARQDSVTPPAPRTDFRREPGPFERAKYDRLRVLGSELKRVRRDGGAVAVYLAPERQLSERILDGIFGCV